MVERGNGTENPAGRYAVSTREPSERKLPTDHEHEAGSARPSNISMINRRQSPPRPPSHPAHNNIEREMMR